MNVAKRCLLVGVVVCLMAGAALQAAFPPPQGYIADVAGVLDDATRQELTLLLRETEAQTTAEVAIAVVPSLDGLTIEDYAVQLFKQWGVGQKGVNNGVLVVVAPQDRQVRIEVGYGLEGVLPDGLTGNIIRTQFIPKFETQDYAGGVRDGVNRIVGIIRAGHVLTAEERSLLDAPSQPREDWWLVLFLAPFVAICSVSIGLGLRAKAAGPIMLGLIIGGVLSLFVKYSAPTSTIYFLPPFALMMAVVGFRLGRRRKWRAMVRESSTSSGWVMGEGGSSSSDSGSSSGGSSSGDSFGGGSSGGGGASGHW